MMRVQRMAANLKWKSALAAVAVLLLTHESALAVPVVGSQGLAVIDVATDNTSLASVTSFTLMNLTTQIRTGDFLTFNAPSVTLDTTTLNTGSVVGFTLSQATWGLFTASTLSFDTFSSNTRSIKLEGTFTPGTWYADATPVAASVLFTFNQNGGPGKAISGSATLNVPARNINAVPEPSTMMLSALGFLLVTGLGYARRRAV